MKLLRTIQAVVLLPLLVIVGNSLFVNGNQVSDLARGNQASEIASKWNNIRLPTTIVPLQYDLYLHPNLTDGQFKYNGNVNILLEVREETDFIVLHSLKLNHEITRLVEFQPDSSANDEKKIPIRGTVFNETNQQAIIELGSKISPDKKYLLTIYFKGELRSILTGFYRSSYKTKDGETRYIASTQFEATGARLAFPCFDEPSLKARFRIHMVREKQYTALSNMPVEEEFVRPDGLVVDHFKESVKMSTYLVAFIVCDFQKLSAKSKRGIIVNVWAPKDQISQAKFAIEIAPKILDHYEDFFNVQFPLPKQDLIGIPDFAMGAMENWGLITYRLTALLYDPNESSEVNKQRVAEVIAHEMAHQWFGNLVTMKWWNDLWLNEGFAAFVQSVGTGYLYPEWKMDQQFVTENVQAAMVADAHEHSHPISVKVSDPAEIGALFDLISYQKGSSVIRMMQDFLGKENMMRGLTNYLEGYKYSNAASDDLWEELSKEAAKKLNVKTIMDTWTTQMGYPVVTVKRDGGEAVLTQERFVTDSTKKFDSTWNIPITYYFQKARGKQSRWYLGKKQKEGIHILWKKSLGWIKVNVDQVGFYRVNYEKENWQALAHQLNTFHTFFSGADRSNLIDDAFALANVGRVNFVQALEMTEYLAKEKDYVPFSTATRVLGTIGGLLSGEGAKAYENYIMEKIMPSVRRLGWTDTGSHLDKYLRGLVLNVAVENNCKTTVPQAKALFKEWMEKGTVIPANVRTIVYHTGIKYGGAIEWHFMFKKYMKCLYPSEQRLLMMSLSYTTDPDLLRNYLRAALDEKYVRAQDAHMLIAQIAHNSAANELAYQFIVEYWPLIIGRYCNEKKALTRILEGVFAGGKTEKDFSKAKEFFDNHDLGAAKISSSQILGTIRNHIVWLEKNEKTVVDWLKKKVEK